MTKYDVNVPKIPITFAITQFDHMIISLRMLHAAYFDHVMIQLQTNDQTEAGYKYPVWVQRCLLFALHSVTACFHIHILPILMA